MPRARERSGSDGPRRPYLVGQTLPAARDAARAVGFERFTSHDATGSRTQFDKAGWIVCSQVPAAGATDRTATVDVAVVKETQPCAGVAAAATTTTAPASPQPAPEPAPKPAPKPAPQSDPEPPEESRPKPTRTSEPDPDPPAKPRSGQSGHPCLPGERDGDNDGYCGEGR